MRLWREQNWRDYIPSITHERREDEYAVGFSIGNSNCDPLVAAELTFHPLWRDTGEAIQSALRDQATRDYQTFGITWPMILSDRVRRVERKFYDDMSKALGLGTPDIVIFDDPPLELRDDAE